MTLQPQEIVTAVRQALEEDIGTGDVTTLSMIPRESSSIARMVAREPMVVAGLAFAIESFRALEPLIKLSLNTADGETIAAGHVLLTIEGQTRAILGGERVALNYIQRLSGIATATGQFVRAVHGTHAQILDTRKTTPGWRRFEKYAVFCGGGINHRMGLYDRVLIKDNHLASLADALPNPITAAVNRARCAYPDLLVEVEADNLEQVLQAIESKADIVLLDNMSLEMLTKAVSLSKGRVLTEASGGVSLNTVRSISETGVDYISVGAITHSVRAVDIGLDF